MRTASRRTFPPTLSLLCTVLAFPLTACLEPSPTGGEPVMSTRRESTSRKHRSWATFGQTSVSGAVNSSPNARRVGSVSTESPIRVEK